MREVYKITNGAEKINSDLLFTMFNNTRTREHEMKSLDSRV